MTDERFAQIAGLEYLKWMDIYYKNDKYYCEREDWLPRQKIEQAMMVLEAFDYWEITKMPCDDPIYQCNIGTKDFKPGALGCFSGNSNELAEAICSAVEESEK